MKKIFLLISFFIGVSTNAQEDVSKLDWLLDFDEALSQSEKEHKPILIYFTGSDWCAPCKMLKEDFFSTSEFEARSKNMVLLLVDIPRKVDVISKEQKEKNMKLVSIYNKKGGYPNLVAVNSHGKVIGELGGYTFLRETDRHFAFVDSVIENYQ
jgi:thioredoxin-related protein